MDKDDTLRCSFCGRNGDEVAYLLAGGAQNVYICGDCVDTCVDIINREKSSGHTPPASR
jgi:ATP-dependent Clp protease ATP-binding subunit ClpX